jgi:signal transduction histidine kinase
MPDNKLKNIRILTGLTFFLVTATAVIATLTVRGLNQQIQLTIRTKDIMELSDELYSSVLEAESNLRGYMLSGDGRFISDYSKSKQLCISLSDSLRTLTSDNYMQQTNVRVLRSYIIERTSLLDSLFAVYSNDPSSENSVVRDVVRRGKTLTVQIRSRINEINNQERSLLDERTSGVNRYLNILPAILVFTTLTGLGAGALTIYSVYQYRVSKRNADKKIAEYQQQLQDQINRLNTSNRELEQFAYVASHDLQEPLRKISAFAELLSDQYKDKLHGDGEIYIDRITNSSQRMRSLITDLLNYSRVSRTTTTEPVNLNSLVGNVKDDLEILIKEKRARIDHSPLPIVTGNNLEFRQLFQNLISNSLKFSKPGVDPVITIVSGESTAEDLAHVPLRDYNTPYVTIRFTDNGIGFEEEYAEKIFVIFQRLHGKDSYEGTGIGLAICKKIAEKYGGTIYARSSIGNGASFFVILPAS